MMILIPITVHLLQKGSHFFSSLLIAVFFNALRNTDRNYSDETNCECCDGTNCERGDVTNW